MIRSQVYRDTKRARLDYPVCDGHDKHPLDGLPDRIVTSTDASVDASLDDTATADRDTLHGSFAAHVARENKLACMHPMLIGEIIDVYHARIAELRQLKRLYVTAPTYIPVSCWCGIPIQWRKGVQYCGQRHDVTMLAVSCIACQRSSAIKFACDFMDHARGGTFDPKERRTCPACGRLAKNAVVRSGERGVVDLFYF